MPSSRFRLYDLVVVVVVVGCAACFQVSPSDRSLFNLVMELIVYESPEDGRHHIGMK